MSYPEALKRPSFCSSPVPLLGCHSGNMAPKKNVDRFLAGNGGKNPSVHARSNGHKCRQRKVDAVPFCQTYFIFTVIRTSKVYQDDRHWPCGVGFASSSTITSCSSSLSAQFLAATCNEMSWICHRKLGFLQTAVEWLRDSNWPRQVRRIGLPCDLEICHGQGMSSNIFQPKPYRGRQKESRQMSGRAGELLQAQQKCGVRKVHL